MFACVIKDHRVVILSQQLFTIFQLVLSDNILGKLQYLFLERRLDTHTRECLRLVLKADLSLQCSLNKYLLKVLFKFSMLGWSTPFNPATPRH